MSHLTPAQHARLGRVQKVLFWIGISTMAYVVAFCFYMAHKCETDLRFCLNPIACQVWQ